MYTAVMTQQDKDLQEKVQTRYTLHIYGNQCSLSGYTQKDSEVISHTRTSLVLKVKGGNYWAGQGITGYAPAEFQVYDLTHAEKRKIAPGIKDNGSVLYRNCRLVAAWNVQKRRWEDRHQQDGCLSCTKGFASDAICE